AQPHSSAATQQIATLESDALEIRITVAREQAQRKRFGVQLFANDQYAGLPILLHPETGTLRVGEAEAPFAAADLAPEEDLELRIFIDKYLVEVFANERQAVVTAHMDYQAASGLKVYTYGGPTTIQSVTIQRMKSANQGFFQARESRIWQPQTS
ncbi:MAG: GH32 C-terminal domain-containing protein, partial [Caldilineaceae bacterium]|nr:GH32 C-terminal domain-containing protein [Caldilineaceae bacterium]